MKTALFKLVAGCAAIVSLAGCGKPAVIYQMTEKDALAALDGSEIPEQVLMMLGGQDATVSTGKASGHQVIWRVKNSSGLDSGMELVALLKATESGTEVDADLRATQPNKAAQLDERLAKLPGAKDLFRTIVFEQVDSTLKHRAFDIVPITSKMSAVAMANFNPAAVRKDMEKAAKEFDRRDRETVDRAYANEGHSSHGSNYVPVGDEPAEKQPGSVRDERSEEQVRY